MSESPGAARTVPPQPKALLGRLHPWPVRIMHWTNAAAMVVMIGSGWGIYDDSVILHGVYFPKAIRLGSWAAESLLWHFAGMWLLVANGAAYLIYGLATGRLRERLLPIRARDIVLTVRDTLRLKLAHEDLTDLQRGPEAPLHRGDPGRHQRRSSAAWRSGSRSSSPGWSPSSAASRAPASSISPAWQSWSASWPSTSRSRCWCRRRSGRCWPAAQCAGHRARAAEGAVR